MSECFRFGAFELDVTAYALKRAGAPVKLEKLPMEALIRLVASAGALVGRQDLRAALWRPDVFVDQEAAINTVMRKIRRALGDHAETPRFVETVVGKGYRFIAPVARRGPATLTAPPRHATANFRVTRGKQEFLLGPGVHLVGRDPDAQVFIDHASVSRRHAQIEIDADRAILEDLKSRNGTFLNGRRLDGPATIAHGATIGLGPITLTFHARSAAKSTLPMSGA